MSMQKVGVKLSRRFSVNARLSMTEEGDASGSPSHWCCVKSKALYPQVSQPFNKFLGAYTWRLIIKAFWIDYNSMLVEVGVGELDLRLERCCCLSLSMKRENEGSRLVV